MGQARFYLMNGEERVKLKAFTTNGAQLVAVESTYDPEDIENNVLLIMTVLAPPVFYDSSHVNNFNIGDYGDQNITREE